MSSGGASPLKDGEGSGGERSGGRAPYRCSEGKDTGDCQERSVAVQIPEKVLMRKATKPSFQKRLSEIARCRLKPIGSTSVEIVVSVSNAHRLPELEKEYKLLLSQLYPIGPGWCYIHRNGVEECQEDEKLHFQVYGGRLPLAPDGKHISAKFHELCIKKEYGADSGDGECTVDELVAKSPQQASDTRERAHGAMSRTLGAAPFNPKMKGEDIFIKIIKEHEAHMKERLEDGLEWFCQEMRGKGKFIAKLEGRFGKILWKNLPEDVHGCNWGIEKFADLCFSNPKRPRIFTPDVKRDNASNIKRYLTKDHVSMLETFDVKFTNPEGGRKRMATDVRIKFEAGRPNVLLAKKNEVKIVVFDILCLHSNHDLRTTLNCCEVMDNGTPEYKVVERLISTIHLSDSDKGTITLQARTEDWSVNFIRHKKRESYCVGDKYIITVTTVRECQLDCQLKKEDVNMDIDVIPECYSDEHIEVEFHNLSWECAFGRDVGFTPEKSLALLMEHRAVTPGVIPHPWQPDHILKDFQEFIDQLDIINGMLGPSP